MISKTNLIEIIAREENITKKDVEKVINKAIDTIIQAVSDGEKVNIKSFGTFISRNRTERTGHDPRTGQSIIIEAHKTPSFKAGKAFKQSVNR